MTMCLHGNNSNRALALQKSSVGKMQVTGCNFCKYDDFNPSSSTLF